jgi:hypothetical protein
MDASKDLQNRMIRELEGQEQSSLQVSRDMAGLLGAEGTVEEGREDLGHVHSPIQSALAACRLVTSSHDLRQLTATLPKCYMSDIVKQTVYPTWRSVGMGAGDGDGQTGQQ